MEALSQDALSAKLASPLYSHLLDTRSALDEIQKEKEEAEGEVSHLLDILSSLKSSYNPNYQDMGVLAAVREYDAYVDTHNKKIDTSSTEQLTKLQNEDLVALVVSLDQAAPTGQKSDDLDAVLFNIEAYLPPSLLDNYRSIKKMLVGWLVKLSIIPSHSMQEEGACGFRIIIVN